MTLQFLVGIFVPPYNILEQILSNSFSMTFVRQLGTGAIFRWVGLHPFFYCAGLASARSAQSRA